ncbi:hypothetical protein J7K18_04200 [bacterium]|nr:hypothetical protein [bacterium]
MKRFWMLCFLLLFVFALSGVSQVQKRFEHIVFQGASVQAVFQFLAREGNVNIVLNPNVTGTVTMELVDVTWEEAFNIVLATYNLKKIEEPGCIRVMTESEYMDMDIKKREYEKRRIDLIEPVTRIYSIQYASAEEMAEALSAVLTRRGKVQVDARTNSLLVTEVEDNFPVIEEMIRELDVEARQIRINAKIVLIDADYTRELGIQWSAKKKTGTEEEKTIASLTPGLGELIGTFTWGTISGEYDLSAMLAAAITSGKGTIVDHPEITTLDNREAEIFSGKEITITIPGGVGASGATQTIRAGTRLTVTPHVTAEDRIMLTLSVERTAEAGSEASAAGGGVVTVLTRSASTQMIVDDGGTAVIGGLTGEEEKVEEAGVPLLKDLPLIGPIFKKTRRINTSSDLIIFVTPTIVKEATETRLKIQGGDK